jgi:uncharacterized protein (DUF1697 family)
MTTYIALLRGINVGGNRTVPMQALREFLGVLGCDRPRSLIQTGNLVFGNRRTSGDGVERWLEAQAAKRLGLTTEFFVRTAAEWQDMIAQNPFTAEAVRDPARLHVVMLKAPPAKAAVSALRAAIVGREVVEPGSRHIYAMYPDGMGTSKLTMAVMESRLGTRVTARNWNTARKIAALSAADT